MEIKKTSVESAKTLGRWASSIKNMFFMPQKGKNTPKSNKERRIGRNNCVLS